jgi:hypothetical protein
MPLVESSDHDFIRKRIDAQFNASSLPSTVIESYEDEAEEWVAARVTDLDDIAESVVAADVARYARAKRAALYYVASLIAPTVNIPTSDAGIAGASYTRKVMEPGANAARLLALAEKELDAATVEVEVAVRGGRSGSAAATTIW